MEGDLIGRHKGTGKTISIHSLRMEGDQDGAVRIERRCNFNPLPPHGGRPSATLSSRKSTTISIHSLRMEGDVGNGRALHTLDISIHSLRMEGDSMPLIMSLLHRISIHSLRMEGDI